MKFVFFLFLKRKYKILPRPFTDIRFHNMYVSKFLKFAIHNAMIKNMISSAIKITQRKRTEIIRVRKRTRKDFFAFLFLFNVQDVFEAFIT